MLERELFADDPESLAALHDVLLVDGLRHQLRAVLYDGRTFLGYCGAYSEVGQPDYDLEDRAVMQALVEPLRDVLWSARVIGGGRDAARKSGKCWTPSTRPRSS